MHATLSTQAEEIELIPPFANSTRSVLDSMANVAVSIGTPYLKDDNDRAFDVSVVIGFMGGLRGSVIISFDYPVACDIATRLAGDEIGADSPDLADAIGEFCNMIVGSAKRHLGVQASISVPTVIIGASRLGGRLSAAPCMIIPCSMPCGDFIVEVNIMRAD